MLLVIHSSQTSTRSAGTIVNADIADATITAAKLAFTSSTEVYVMKDSQGDVFGEVIDFGSSNSWLIHSDFGGTLFEISVTFQANSAGLADDLYVISPSFSASTLHYTTNDCSGTPYYQPTAALGRDFFGLFTRGIMHGPFNASSVTDQRILYKPTNTTEVTLDIESTETFSFACSDIATTSTSNLIPMEVVDANVQTSFPQPYTIVLQ